MPPRFADAMARYQSGSKQLREGMDTATAAFLRFDWDVVAVGLEEFSRGASEIDSSYLLLKEIVTGEGTPSAANASMPVTFMRTGLTFTT